MCVVDMWATADFEAEWFVGTISDHLVHFHGIAVAVAELAEGAEWAGGFGGGVFGPRDFQVFSDLFVDDFFDLLDLFWCHFAGVAEVKAQALFGNVTAVLNDMVTKDVTQCLIHQVRSSMVFLVLQRLAAKATFELPLAASGCVCAVQPSAGRTRRASFPNINTLLKASSTLSSTGKPYVS